MEASFDETTERNVKAMDFSSLRRYFDSYPKTNEATVDSLERDLEFLYGRNWKQVVKPSPETQAYVARIREVAENKPSLLIAHQYTRYLGSVSP